jgi:hypothetical protein
LSIGQAGARQVGEVVLAVLPGVEDDGHVRGGRRAGGGADRLVPGAELADQGGELGDVGPVAGVGRSRSVLGA